MSDRKLTRRDRRQLRRAQAAGVTIHPAVDAGVDAAMRRHPSNQAPAAVPPPCGRPGLVKRARGALMRRMVDKLGPAVVPPLVAGAVVLVTVGVVLGLALGVLLASTRYDGYDQ